jgi:hypothetical protein
MTIEALQQCIDKMMRLLMDRQTEYDTRVQEIHQSTQAVDPEIEALKALIEASRGDVEQAEQVYKDKEAML